MHDGLYYLDGSDVAETQRHLSRTADKSGYRPPAGALVMLREGSLRIFRDPDFYLKACARCEMSEAECRCEDSDCSADAADNQHPAQDERVSEDEGEDSESEGEESLQDEHGDDLATYDGACCASCGDTDYKVITAAYNEGYYHCDGVFYCSNCHGDTGFPCGAECADCGETYHWVSPRAYVSGLYHTADEGGFVCASCTLKTCETCGTKYTPSGCAPPFANDGSLPEPTWGFRAGSHRKCESCWTALADGQAAPVAVPAAAKRARDRDGSERDNRARHERDIKKLQRAFRGHCSHHLFHYWIKGRSDGACSRDDCERSHEMPPRVELAKLDLETPLP